MEKISITEWFNPHDADHLRAYVVLIQTGIWPQGFLPSNITFPVLWTVVLIQKMADAWVSYALTRV